MNNISTPHINAKKTDFAKTILMPGDPLRSKYIAEKYLTDAKLVNNIRGIQGWTGYYKGKRISVMAHGMGMSSMSIYAYELFNFYDIKNIIRIGSCGGLTKDMRVKDVAIISSTMTPSNIGKRIFKPLKEVECSPKLLEIAKKLHSGKPKTHITKAVTFDIFDLYGDPKDIKKFIKKGCTCSEMEIYALYLTALRFNKNALAFLTISDNSITNEYISPEERENSFDEMVVMALETAINIK